MLFQFGGRNAGAGLALQGMVMLSLDFLAHRRAGRYLMALRDFNPSVARDGFSQTWRGTF